MEQKAGLEHQEMPRRCGRHTQQNNVPVDSTYQYFESYFYPFVKAFINQLDMWFNTMARQACLVLCLLPNNIKKLNEESIQSLIETTMMIYRSRTPSNKNWGCGSVNGIIPQKPRVILQTHFQRPAN